MLEHGKQLAPLLKYPVEQFNVVHRPSMHVAHTPLVTGTEAQETQTRFWADVQGWLSYSSALQGGVQLRQEPSDWKWLAWQFNALHTPSLEQSSQSPPGMLSVEHNRHVVFCL